MIPKPYELLYGPSLLTITPAILKGSAPGISVQEHIFSSRVMELFFHGLIGSSKRCFSVKLHDWFCVMHSSKVPEAFTRVSHVDDPPCVGRTILPIAWAILASLPAPLAKNNPLASSYRYSLGSKSPSPSCSLNRCGKFPCSSGVGQNSMPPPGLTHSYTSSITVRRVFAPATASSSTLLASVFMVSYTEPTLVNLHMGCMRLTTMWGADVAPMLDIPTPDRTQSLSRISSLPACGPYSSFTDILTLPGVASPSAFEAKSLYVWAKSDMAGFSTHGLSGMPDPSVGAQDKLMVGISLIPRVIVASLAERMVPWTLASTSMVTTLLFISCQAPLSG